VLKEDDILGLAADACKKSGVGEWEVYLLEAERFNAEAKEGKLDMMETSRGRGVAIRVRVNSKPGFSYSTDFGKANLRKAVEAAIAGAKAADADPEGAFAAPGEKVPVLDSPDARFDQIAQSEKLDRAISVETAALSVDRRIVRVRNAAYTESSRRVRLVNHLGVERDARANVCSASLIAVAQQGAESQSGWDADHSAKYDGLDYEAVGRRAASDAVELLGARTLPTQKAPVIFRNNAATQLLEVLAESFSGESVAKGRSMLAGKIGKKIFSDKITVTDNGILKGGAASFPFDGEGAPRQATILVDSGTLRGFLYDLKWARKAGAKSTGNAARNGYLTPPRPAITNLFIKPGGVSFEKLLKDVHKGLLVAELMGVHMANPVTGDFSFGASGWWIENGRKSYPAQGVTVAGNILKLLASVDKVADDLRFMSEVGSPSILVRELDIGGE